MAPNVVSSLLSNVLVFSRTGDIYNVRAAKTVSIKSLQYFKLFKYAICGGDLDCILYCICIRVLAPYSLAPQQDSLF